VTTTAPVTDAGTGTENSTVTAEAASVLDEAEAEMAAALEGIATPPDDTTLPDAPLAP